MLQVCSTHDSNTKSDPVTTHYDDEEQAERLKQWWKENWISLAAGLAIGLGAIFGWEGWKSYQDTRAAEASRMYEDLRLALSESRAQDAEQIGAALIQAHGGSPYASGAALYLATDAVKRGELDQALTHLSWVREHGSDDGVREVAALRSARVLWQQGKPDEALALIAGDGGEFQAMSQELRGDILLSKGDRAAAREAYQKALGAGSDEDVAARGDLQRKLDDLNDVVES